MKVMTMRQTLIAIMSSEGLMLDTYSSLKVLSGRNKWALGVLKSWNLKLWIKMAWHEPVYLIFPSPKHKIQIHFSHYSHGNKTSVSILAIKNVGDNALLSLNYHVLP